MVSLAVAMAAVSSSAQTVSTNLALRFKSATVPAAIMPPSPVDYFRNLLAMSPQQREKVLAKKTPAIRARIMAKVSEYAALDPRDRESRLEATELRWFLMPLLRASPSERDGKLALVPANIRGLVKSRLMQWEILPPALQTEFLENEHILGYFSGVEETNRLAGDAAPSGDEQSRWNALSDGERKAMMAQFNQFFELAPYEEQKALGTLPETDRAQMERAMQIFGKLPQPQRGECIRALSKFAGMSPLQRAIFLRNAQRWSQMSPSERKAWGDLVEHVPQWPPMPVVPPPVPMPPGLHTVAITNHG